MNNTNIMLNYGGMSRYACVCVGIIVISTILLWDDRRLHNGSPVHCDMACVFITRLKGPVKGDHPALLSYLRRHVLIPPSILPYNLSSGKIETERDKVIVKKIEFFQFINKTFGDKPPGFFVEAGALDGQHMSNTLWLEKEKHWTGVLIEPYQVNCKNMFFKRRKSWTACSCVTRKLYATTTVLEIPTEYSQHTRNVLLYRANARSIESTMHSVNDSFQVSSTFTYNTVQCFPLVTYLAALNITVVDLLSLDTQGGEKGVLLTFPFHKVKVRHLLVEHVKENAMFERFSLDEEFVAEMRKRNFKLVEFMKYTENSEYIFSLND